MIQLRMSARFGMLNVFIGGLALVTCSCNTPDTTATAVPGCKPLAQFSSEASFQSMALETVSHIPRAAAKMSDEGSVAASRPMSITIALKLNHEEELDRRILETYTPGSPNYRKFMSSAEFRERYAPTQAQIDQVQAFLYGNGVTNVRVNPNGYLLSASASAGTVSKAFGTELRQYRDRSGKRYFSAAREPKFPDGLRIRAVHGLHNFGEFKPHFKMAAEMVPGSGFGPQDIRSAYQIPASATAAGQTIAIVALDGYLPSDISAYWNAFGVTPVPLQNILVDGATGFAGSESAETTMDIELVTSIAKNAAKVLVYEAPNSAQAVLDLYSRIANDNLASVVTTSWGGPESMQSTSFLETESAILKQMAVQGQTVFAASGDEGAYADEMHLGVIDPASQPFVVAVGGTRLATSGGAYAGETTWNSGSPSQGAGGGGVSALWVQPSWQASIATSLNRGSSSMRNVPDVSLNADPATGYAIVINGRWATVGGTSAAAPIWAGFTALINERRAELGISNVGFLNPLLYSIGASSRYGSDFNDIRDGSTNLYYPATSGYDNATGWGTMNGQGLFEDLIQESSVSTSAIGC